MHHNPCYLSELSLALCTAFDSLAKTSGISEKTCLSSIPHASVHWRQSPFLFETRIFDWFHCLISKNTNTAASGSIQNNECMFVVHLVTPGLVWPRNKVIVLWLLQVEFLSRLLTPALVWGRSQERVWVKFGLLVSLVASTFRHLSEISTWQALSSQAACAGKGGKPLPRHGGTHLCWLTAKIYKDCVLSEVLGGMIWGPKSQLMTWEEKERVSCKGLRECRHCPSGRSWCSWNCHHCLLPSSQSVSGLKVHSQLIKQSFHCLSVTVSNHKAVYDCGKKSLVLHPKYLL